MNINEKLNKVINEAIGERVYIDFTLPNPDHHSESDVNYFQLCIAEDTETGKFSWAENSNDETRTGFKSPLDAYDDAVEFLSEEDGFKISMDREDIKKYFTDKNANHQLSLQ